MIRQVTVRAIAWWYIMSMTTLAAAQYISMAELQADKIYPQLTVQQPIWLQNDKNEFFLATVTAIVSHPLPIEVDVTGKVVTLYTVVVPKAKFQKTVPADLLYVKLQETEKAIPLHAQENYVPLTQEIVPGADIQCNQSIFLNMQGSLYVATVVCIEQQRDLDEQETACLVYIPALQLPARVAATAIYLPSTIAREYRNNTGNSNEASAKK
ncbi:hypothetical protein M1466_03235 [Candidatus Dependentiae bacterium]|nr:hypothetical protein [Candidatus Dependentiae bacterium]